MIPQIKFILSPEYDKRKIFCFVSPKKGDWDWSEKIFAFHPELKKRLKNISEAERKKEIERYIEELLKEKSYAKILEKKKEKIEEEWKKIHEKFIGALFEILNLKETKINKITCSISLNPICPRELDENFFSVFYGYDMKTIKVIIAHEIIHFYYFEKWRQTFEDFNPKNFEGPHLIWHLSEILAPIIIANSKIQKLLNELDKGYPEHGKIDVGGKNIIEHFDSLYEKFDKKRDFGEFLKEAYAEIKKYRNELANS